MSNHTWKMLHTRQKQSLYNCNELESQYLVSPLLFFNTAWTHLGTFSHHFFKKSSGIILQTSWNIFKALLWMFLSLVLISVEMISHSFNNVEFQFMTDVFFYSGMNLLYWQWAGDQCHADKWSCCQSDNFQMVDPDLTFPSCSYFPKFWQDL